MLYAPWPAFLVVAGLIVVAGTAPFARLDDPAPRPGARVRTLDGLRGILALCVFFHHAIITRGYLLGGPWTLPPSRFYSLIGQFGVAMFFMITGYLFWQRMLAENGRPNWVLLYLGRVFRIGPLYLLAIAGLFALVAARSGWRMNSTLGGLLKEGGAWLPLGALGVGPDINRLRDTWTITAGVTWTLEYEWIFYASLLLTAVAARFPRARLFAPLLAFIAVSAGLTTSPNASAVASNGVCAALFLVGMVSASLHAVGLSCPGPGWLRSIVTLSLVGESFAIFPSLYGIGAVVVLAPAFFLVVSGCDLFGALTSRGAIRLGEVSYGIYLLHGLLLSAIFLDGSVRAFALSSDLRYWCVVAACALLLLALSAAAHLLVERPGIAAGRRLGKVWKRNTPHLEIRWRRAMAGVLGRRYRPRPERRGADAGGDMPVGGGGPSL